MNVTSVDTSAVLGTSALHHAAARSKLVAAGLVIAAVVVARDVFFVAGIALALVGLAGALGLPLRRMLPFALYPALFAAIFAFASAPGPVVAALIVLKAVTAALAVVVLMFTTPYPQVFAPLQRVLPSLVGDTLLMTYRSLFLLAQKFGDLLVAVKLRAGLSAGHPVRAAKATTRALGGLLLYSFDLSQREYDVLRLRGYESRLRISPKPSTRPAADAGAILFGVYALSGAYVASTFASASRYTWLVAALSLVVALAGTVVSWRKR